MAGDQRRSVVVQCVEVASVTISGKEEAKQAEQWEVGVSSEVRKFGKRRATEPNLPYRTYLTELTKLLTELVKNTLFPIVLTEAREGLS